MSSGVMISGIFLSSVQTIVYTAADYIAEHPIPALEGGVVEQVGHPSDRVELHGFLYSGSDADKATLQGMLGFMRRLAVPSPISGSFAISGDILIDKISFQQPEGRQYPYYQYVLRAVFPASGVVYFISSGVSGTAGSSSGEGFVSGISGLPSRFIDYSQVLPIFASIHPDYSQVLPISISIHPDYSQVLPVGISIHPDYVQVLPLGVSIHANYVRIS